MKPVLDISGFRSRFIEFDIYTSIKYQAFLALSIARGIILKII